MKKNTALTLILTFISASLLTGCVAVADPEPQTTVVNPRIDGEVTVHRESQTVDPYYGQATTTSTTRTTAY